MKYQTNITIILILSLFISQSFCMFEFLKFCNKNDDYTMDRQKKSKMKKKNNDIKNSKRSNNLKEIVTDTRVPLGKMPSSHNQMGTTSDTSHYYQNNMHNIVQMETPVLLTDFDRNMMNHTKYIENQEMLLHINSGIKMKPEEDHFSSTMGVNVRGNGKLPIILVNQEKIEMRPNKSKQLLNVNLSPINNGKDEYSRSKAIQKSSLSVGKNLVDKNNFSEMVFLQNGQDLTRGQKQFDKILGAAKEQQREVLNSTIMLNDKSQIDFDEMSTIFGFNESGGISDKDLKEDFLIPQNESTLLNKTLMEDFDAEETMEKLKRTESMIFGGDSNNLIPSVTKFLEEMKRDVKQEVFNLVNKQVSDANVEQSVASLGLDKYFQNMLMKNRRQRNCVFLQEMLKAMPSQRKTWTRKIKNFFSSAKVNNLKSYRTLGIDMVLNLEVNPAEKLNLRSLVEQYRLAKGLYYSQYMVGWKANLDIEQDQKNELQSLIASQSKIVLKRHSEYEILVTQISTNHRRLGYLVEQMLAGDIQLTMEEKAKYKKLMETARDSADGIPAEEFAEFGKSSTVGRMVLNFNTATTKYLKWTAIESALTHHFLNKKKLGLSIYSIETDPNLLKNVIVRVNQLQTFFTNKAESEKKKLVNYIKEYVDELGNTIGQNKLYSEYSNLILTSAQLVEKKEEAEKVYLEENMKLEEAKFKAQKLDFAENFDYVFPSGLIMSLQKKKRELDTILNRYGEGSGYFTLNDSDKFLKLSEEGRFNKFFTKEAEDLMITRERVEKQLNIAVEIDNIEGEIDFFLGSIISRTNSVEQNKGCFSLSQISYFVFLLFKTNVIAKQTRFLEGFFDQMDERLSKEFVVFNYMLFTPQDYVDDLLERYKSTYSVNAPMLEEEDRKSFFTKDYIMNYTIMINFYKDMTEFGAASTGVVQRSSNFVKSLLNLAMTYLNGNLDTIEEKGMEKVVDFLTTVVTEAFSFLSVIPFAEDLVKGALSTVLKLLLEYMSAFFAGVAQYFSRVHGSMVNKKIEDAAKQDFYLDFDAEIQKLVAPEEAKKSASFNHESSISTMEKKYLESIAATSSVFNKLQNLSTFKDKDYQNKANKIFQNVEKVNKLQNFRII